MSGIAIALGRSRATGDGSLFPSEERFLENIDCEERERDSVASV